MLLIQVLACLLDEYVYLCMYGVYLGGKGRVINMNTLDDLDQHFEVYNRLTFDPRIRWNLLGRIVSFVDRFKISIAQVQNV